MFELLPAEKGGRLRKMSADLRKIGDARRPPFFGQSSDMNEESPGAMAGASGKWLT
jgi:hypothetical protein